MSTLTPSLSPSRSIFSRLHLIGKSRSQNLTEKRISSDSRPAATTVVDQEKTTTVRADVPEPTVEGDDTLPNGVGAASNGVEPICDGKGSNIIGPRNYDREAQSVGLVRPPPTDKGTLPSFKWSFADSHMRIEESGWARQATVREIPTTIELAGVSMQFLEIFRTPKFEYFSLDQWLAVTPPQMVLEHLNLVDEEKDMFSRALNATKVPLKADASM